MNKKFVLIVLSSLIVQGCKDEISSSAKIVERQIQKCQVLMSNGELRCNHEDFRDLRHSLSQSITNVLSKTIRQELASQYIAMVKGIDLTFHAEGYENYEMRVFRFGKLTGTIFNVLKKVDIDKSDLMDYFFGCLEKYQRACFSIPTTGRENGESVSDFLQRKATVSNLHAMYLSRMCMFERGEVEEHLAFFPVELHDEYRRRSASILSYPSREDLLRTPMFNGK